MARNSVQFQKGLSEARFDELYGSEDRCREAVFAWRWPHGFVCPGCGGQHYCVIKTRGLYQCTSCRRQTSLIAGTIFASTKVPLRSWFRAMYQLTQSKGGISQKRSFMRYLVLSLSAGVGFRAAHAGRCRCKNRLSTARDTSR